MKISGYKCFTCRSISETRHTIKIVFDKTEFSVERSGWIRDFQDTVCSYDCARAALNAWVAEAQKADEEDAKEQAKDLSEAAQPCA